MMVTARDLMETEVLTVSPDLALSDLEEVLLRKRVQGAPVVEDGRLVGIISRSDVVRQLKLEEERIAESAFYFEPFDADRRDADEDRRVMQAAAGRLATLRVRDMMVPDIETIGPEVSVEDVARRMLDRRIHRLLVTEGDTLLGLVSSLDLVELIASGRARFEEKT
ncbi:MAG: CBS domain-containing protein [Myxococcota bacterium]